VLEADTVGFGASGRNGGFVVSSLTHGIGNGLARFGPEMPALERLGAENFAGLEADVARHGIDCRLELTGDLVAILEPYQEAWIEEEVEVLRRFGHDVVVLDGPAVRAEVDSPTYRAGIWDRTGAGLLDPGRLADGLRTAAERIGVRMFEGTPAEALEPRGEGVDVRTPHGRVRARRVLLATSAFPPLLRAIRRYVVPVYDYALVTEPLSAEQRAAIGWRRRQGMSDSNNQFHYFRLTADDRILWGGYDAVYYTGNGVGPEYDRRPATTDKLERQFRAAFPQLGAIAFPYRWGGAIDTTTRFTVTFGQALGGRLTYSLGYTGLGVGASRWAAGVVRDFILRPDSDLLKLRFVRTPPFPFPPEPLRSLAVNTVRWELDRADRNEGRRGLVLRTLDALGIGFDS